MIDAVSEGCEAFVAGGYDLQQYLKDYDPAVWGNDKVASGPQEDARVASAANQDSVIKAERPQQHHHRRRRQELRHPRRQPPDQGRLQRHPAQPHHRGPARLLPEVGPDRRQQHRQLELRVRRSRRLRHRPRVDRPQHPHRRPLPRQRAAELLRQGLPAARRADRHRARRQLRHRVLELLQGPRQEHADREQRQHRHHRQRQAQGHHAPQQVRRDPPALPARALRTGRRLQQQLRGGRGAGVRLLPLRRRHLLAAVRERQRHLAAGRRQASARC